VFNGSSIFDPVKMHPKHIHISDYTYQLPEDKIAHYPLPDRDLSKVLLYKDGYISEDIYRHIAQHIPEQSLLIFNDTRVIPARMFFLTATGAKVEIFCLEPAEANAEMASMMIRKATVRWKCMLGRANKWKEKVLVKSGDGFTLSAELVDRTADGFIVEFNWQPRGLTFAEILDKAGVMPIPPYLHRESEEVDLQRYQTVYAKQQGSVAAPTAGLHFTERILEQLKEKDIRFDYVTLHVGAGTFKPVTTETMGQHEMHSELINVGSEAIRGLLSSLHQNIIPVGTTSMRTIESLYWMGVKARMNFSSSIHDLEVKQWDPYELPQDISTELALQALIQWMEENKIENLIAKTQIIIAPGYTPRIATALITNFHMPDSTLLLLVAAVIGDDWRRIYDYALNHQFRFLSYGDGSLLFFNEKG